MLIVIQFVVVPASAGIASNSVVTALLTATDSQCTLINVYSEIIINTLMLIGRDHFSPSSQASPVHPGSQAQTPWGVQSPLTHAGSQATVRQDIIVIGFLTN